ncbi:cinnamoyl-CoA reductase 1 [Fagus crenata]
MAKEGEVVCVTGGSGCIGSWLVCELLDHGYTVYATIELLDYASILRALTSCAGVFHLASPCIVDQVHDPEAGQQVKAKAQGAADAAGQQVKAKAQGAADAVKDAVGAKK